MSSSEDYDPGSQDEAESSSELDQSARIEDLRAEASHSYEPTSSQDGDEFWPDVNNDEKSNANSVETDDRPRIGGNQYSSLQDRPPYTAEESYYTRPNRYYGPASTWRSWTQEERAIAESLDRERARDLSAHLYNAHVLSVTARRNVAKASTKGNQRARSREEIKVTKENAFTPPALWTAWPLPPSQVPRENLMPTIGLNTFRAHVNPRPGALLEDCLIATTTRISRQRWEGRQWVAQPDSKDDPTQLEGAISSSADQAKMPENASES